MPARKAFTLVELLVVAAILTVLMGLLLPAVQKVREAANNIKCKNNLKQLGLALHQYQEARGAFPSGGDYKVGPDYPRVSPYLFRWSAHAKILPYLGEGNLYDTLDLHNPLFLDYNYAVAPRNVRGVSQGLAVFRCPSDGQGPFVPVQPPNDEPKFGPTNYLGSMGSGARGNPRDSADGVLFVNSGVRMADLTDGASQTALMSEGLLGLGPGRLAGRPDKSQVPHVYAWIDSRKPVDPAVCGAATVWRADGNSKWADGEVYCALYDHGYPPNAAEWDCVSLSHSWRAARSRHPGGVNLLLCDGSVRFVADGVDLAAWHALGSRAGGEPVGDR